MKSLYTYVVQSSTGLLILSAFSWFDWRSPCTLPYTWLLPSDRNSSAIIVIVPHGQSPAKIPSNNAIGINICAHCIALSHPIVIHTCIKTSASVLSMQKLILVMEYKLFVLLIHVQMVKWGKNSNVYMESAVNSRGKTQHVT